MAGRDFVLTSPLQRGTDVVHLQQALNARLTARGKSPVGVDGLYGPATAHAVRVVAWDLGLQHYEGTRGVVRYIEHPQLRNPVELALAKTRKDEAAKHAQHVGGKSGLEAVVAHAERFIGVQESPPGSNLGDPYPSGWERTFGFDGESWCGAFAGCMVLAAGGHVGPRVAYCPYIEADARSKSNGFDLWVPNHDQGVGPGWLVLYNWSGGSLPEHVGVVKEIHPNYLVAVEGNTGGSNPSDGGMVAQTIRDYSFTVGYARPRF